MKIYKLTVLIFLLVALLGIGYLVIKQGKIDPSLGSVAVSAEYIATSTGQMEGGCGISDKDKLIQYFASHPVTLAQVTVVSTTDSIVKIKNATTTLATGFYTNSSSTVATLPANLPQGTYTFDAILDKGLVLDFETGHCGDYIFTYRW